ncbi:MAG: tetratricopeptide repeat protein [Tepidisphaeraceae bacterium]|jgi:predicted O-linked N-acetylglucosamine transferase (SPINDLY family)
MELTVHEALKLAAAHHRAGRLDQAEELYRLILGAEPDEPDAMAMLGTLLSQRGSHDEALGLIERAIKLRPDAADYHSNRGLVLFAMGLLDLAADAYHKALAIRPDYAEALSNLGNVLQRRNQIDEAIACYHQALALKPDEANAHCNLGGALLKKERFPEAIAAFRRAIEFRPDYAEAMSNLGTALVRDRKADEAIEWYGRAAALRPEDARIVNNFAGALKDAGRLDEAISWYRRAIAVRANSVTHSNLVYALHFHPDYDGRALAAEMARWNEAHARPLAKEIPKHLNYSAPNRRLKIGYVSPNFFDQAEAHFVLPLLAAHDRGQVEVHCFASVRRPDEFTELHRSVADVWHDVAADDDQRLTARIREIPIDILVDLAMHLGDNRLLVFARKPAPIQVTWLAYPGGTGLDAIDYRLTDSCIDPPDGDDSIYSEKSIRLPGCWCCYDPLSESLPRQAEQDGPIVFGSLNNPCKINPRTLRIWAQIVRKVPDSRVLMLSVSESQRGQIRRTFDEVGVPFKRIDFAASCSRQEYLRIYDRIDIALDPLPYNGITTTCDALWMGVPVVTLTGRSAAGRAAASILNAAGLPELIAHSPEQFIQTAAGLALDLPRLITLRSKLRTQVSRSPLMDGPRFARQVEKVYRDIWTQWCAQWER